VSDGFCTARFAPVVLLLAASLAYGAAPSSAQMAHCAGISAPDARLACYDALANRAPGPAPVAGAASAPAAPAPPPTAPPPTAPASTTSPPTAAAAPAAPPPAAVADPKNFGLSLAQQHVEYGGIKSEQARIVSISGGEPGQSLVVLDNGQAWKVTDDDGGLSKGNQVTIKRASLGSFLMVAPSHHVYRVHRIS
jgi:hypothetical protein